MRAIWILLLLSGAAHANTGGVLDMTNYGSVRCSSAYQGILIDKVHTHISREEILLDDYSGKPKTRYEISDINLLFENVQIISHVEYYDPEYYGHCTETTLVATLTMSDATGELFKGTVLCEKNLSEFID